MEIAPGIHIRDLGLFIKKEKTLVISDLHLGYEESLRTKGILIPMFHFQELKKRLLPMIKDTKRIVIAGDLKHEFGKISREEWKCTKDLFSLLEGRELVIIQGNHDPVLQRLVKNIRILPFVRFNNILICHGDKILKEKTEIIIIGHEHPALALRDGQRVERFKCFLKGPWKNSTLIVLPSCNILTQGTDIIEEHLHSPYLKSNIYDFEVFLTGKKVYLFGKVREIRKSLRRINA